MRNQNVEKLDDKITHAKIKQKEKQRAEEIKKIVCVSCENRIRENIKFPRVIFFYCPLFSVLVVSCFLFRVYCFVWFRVKTLTECVYAFGKRQTKNEKDYVDDCHGPVNTFM